MEYFRLSEAHSMDSRSFETRDLELRREMAQMQSKLTQLKGVMGETLRSADR
jgi:hypothetical protein